MVGVAACRNIGSYTKSRILIVVVSRRANHAPLLLCGVPGLPEVRPYPSGTPDLDNLQPQNTSRDTRLGRARHRMCKGLLLIISVVITIVTVSIPIGPEVG